MFKTDKQSSSEYTTSRFVNLTFSPHLEAVLSAGVTALILIISTAPVLREELLCKFGDTFSRFFALIISRNFKYRNNQWSRETNFLSAPTSNEAPSSVPPSKERSLDKIYFPLWLSFLFLPHLFCPTNEKKQLWKICFALGHRKQSFYHVCLKKIVFYRILA